MMNKIKVAELVVEGLQTREGVNDAVVRDYAKEMADGVVFDPPVVFFDGTQYYLADGFHRIAVMKRRGDVEVEADVREGTRTDAIRFALSANAKHGLKRTPADIRRCLEVAWENRVELFGGEPSCEVLAHACAVSKRTVLRFFNRRSASIGDSVTNSENEVTGERSIGDSVTNSEPVTLVSADGKKRTSTKGTRTRKEVAPAKAEERPEKPAHKVYEPWEEDPVGTPLRYGENIFKHFCDPDCEKARDMYIDSKYGTFGKDDISCEWKKDRFGERVPNNLRAIVNRAVLDDFHTLYSCIRKAYDILDEDADAPFMKELIKSKCKPLESIKRIYEAVENADLLGVCDHCHGEGCLECGFKGYTTMGDSRRHTRRSIEKRKEEELMASLKAKRAAEAQKDKKPAKEPNDLKNLPSAEEVLDAIDGRPPQPKIVFKPAPTRDEPPVDEWLGEPPDGSPDWDHAPIDDLMAQMEVVR